MRCFSSPGLLPSLALRMIGLATDRVSPFGNPGSQLVCSSPRLIAAYHVLRRLPVPRHPPCALTRLISVSRCDSSDTHNTHSSVFKEHVACCTSHVTRGVVRHVTCNV